MDYYTGVIFQGFIDGVPAGILSGGRYDNLIHKMGKDADAIGFAVYLDLLERFETTEKEYDVDTLLLYEEGVDTAALAKAAQMLTDNGQSVLVQKKNTGNVKYKQLLCMKDRGLEIVAELD
jgi:ATP phosphoribosyltransferase regulatory subunit